MSRIVGAKEVRTVFKHHVLLVCDFSNKNVKHCLGKGPRLMGIEVGAAVLVAVIALFEADGRTLDKSLIDLRTPRGGRRWAGEQLSHMAQPRLVQGANEIETCWKTLGDLIITGPDDKSRNVYVAKNGATDIELRCMTDFLTGKGAARVRRNEAIVQAVEGGRIYLGGRRLGEVYAENCIDFFKALAAE